MIGIIIISHEKLSEELVRTVEHIMGKQQQLVAISVFADDELEAKRKEIAKNIQQVNSGKGVIIFTDIFGGTPSNLAISLLKANEVEVIAGVNVPMLIKLVQERKKISISEAVSSVIEAGKKYITSASQF